MRDKKDCREKKRTAEEKESLLAGRGGNSNGTRKAAGGEKRTAEKRESRQVGRQSRHGPRKECKKKREETRFPTVKKNKNGPFGDLSERESFIIFMPLYRNRSDMAQTFDIFLIVMALLALVVFAALHFFEAGYGYLFNPKYGPPVPNKIGWVLMESPVFVAMCVLWLLSERTWEAGPLTLFALFQAHYLQRAFIFPLLMRGASKMPLGIVVMGMCFNTLNALMQGGWIFYVSPEGYYADWFAQPYIYIGGAMFLAGMAVNLHSDHIIRNLRRAGRHAPLHSARRHVPLRLVGQLLRRTARMDGLRRGFVVVGRSGVRVVDLRQPRAPRRIAQQTLCQGVRRRIHVARTQKNHTFHLLTLSCHRFSPPIS